MGTSIVASLAMNVVLTSSCLCTSIVTELKMNVVLTSNCLHVVLTLNFLFTLIGAGLPTYVDRCYLGDERRAWMEFFCTSFIVVFVQFVIDERLLGTTTIEIFGISLKVQTISFGWRTVQFSMFLKQQ